MSVRINNKIKYKIKILVKFVFQSPNLQIFHSRFVQFNYASAFRMKTAKHRRYKTPDDVTEEKLTVVTLNRTRGGYHALLLV